MEIFPIQPFAKLLVFLGVILILLGLMMLFGSKIPMIGRLPGDIIIQRKNFTFYFPLTTLILLNLLFYLLFRLLKK